MNNSPEIFGKNLFGGQNVPAPGGKLEERFIIPPFTYLDSTSDAWVARRNAWKNKHPAHNGDDMVLYEILLSWFSPKGGRVPIYGNTTLCTVLQTLGMVPITDIDEPHSAVLYHANVGDFELPDGLENNSFLTFILGTKLDGAHKITSKPGELVKAMEKAGFGYLNEMVVSIPPSNHGGPCIAKVMHKNIYVFVKGCPRIATQKLEQGAENGRI